MKAQIAGLFLIATVLSSSVVSASTLPGIATSVKEDLLIELKDKLLPVFIGQLKDISFPPISFSSGSWIFKETYNISNIKLEELRLSPSSTSLTLSSPSDINIGISNVDIDASFNYDTHGAFGESGSGSFTINGTGISFTIALGDDSGKPTASISNVGVHMGDLHVDISSGWILKVLKFFVNSFAHLFEGIFEKEVSKMIVSKGNAALAKALASFPVSETIPHTSLAVNYSLVEGPEAADDHIQLGVKGEIYDVNSATMPVNPPVAMPDYESTGLGLQMFISSYTVNTVFYSATVSGIASVTLDQSMIPSKLPIRLNTNTFNAIFPGLTAVYGSDKACSLQISLADPTSKIQFTDKDMVLTTETNINLLVGSTVALELVAATDFNATLTVTGSKIFPSLTNAKVNTLTVKKSTIPKFDVATATQNMNDLIGSVKIVLDAIVFSQGLSLPTVDGIDLSDSTIAFNTGYISIQSTPTFTGKVTEFIIVSDEVAPEVEPEPTRFLDFVF